MSDSDPHWPRFWPDVPEADRAPLREVLAELLGRGTLLGTEGSGRDLFLLARDHYQAHITDYLAPLGLELIVDDDFSLLQARPRPEVCLLLAQFTKDETLLLLVLWRAWDDHRNTRAEQTVVLTVDDLWQRFKATFENIEPPEKTQLEQLLARMKRNRLIRTYRNDPTAPIGEMQIEILPSLARTIPFDSIETWLTRVAVYQPALIETPN
ncbi:protein of unknown function [Nitrosospira sp. Nsp11]|uniref:DUF4194 domain-containing protein n=1 Tax=Nitrosospira sp. Nsp11 TaxID=1855338 RepID=UPI00091D09EE|nr:DUF4194 domain-containing protein [Nitrosospira sp. Nsp11]SHL17800.1 protein of unknown function [Nitrosospira sp. Nsp11]